MSERLTREQVGAWRDEFVRDRDGPAFYTARFRDAAALAESWLAQEEALRYYAERRNYLPPAPPGGNSYDAMMARDAYDGNGPGARARAALGVGATDE